MGDGNLRMASSKKPEFVIEIISGSDNAYKLEEKLQNILKSVHVYTSRKQVQICTDDNICSANPVLSEFEIPVNQPLV